MESTAMRTYVGRTPLIRAKNLEEKLGLRKIYLKLEGNNPSGHLEDRLAYLIVRDALSKGQKTICLGNSGRLLYSLAYLSKYFDVNLVLFAPKDADIPQGHIIRENHKIEIHPVGENELDCIEKSNQCAEENRYYNGNPGMTNNILYLYSFSYLASEINTRLKQDPTTLFSQTGEGFSISGLYSGLKQSWINEEIERLPKLYACSTSEGNPIVESFKKGSREILRVREEDISESQYNKNLVHQMDANAQEALNAVYDTQGAVVSITDEELLRYKKEFQALENIHVSTENAYPIAAFMKTYEEGKLEKGTHVIILKDGKVDLDIQEVDKKTLPLPYDEFLELLDSWLIQYSDPLVEIKEAFDNALAGGFVLTAYFDDELAGICVLSKTSFDEFFPKYHLSYIATKKDIKGKGIGTQLMQRAIELSEGNLSLHVEVENENAIKLYEKMGFKRKYYRMLYDGLEKQEG